MQHVCRAMADQELKVFTRLARTGSEPDGALLRGQQDALVARLLDGEPDPLVDDVRVPGHELGLEGRVRVRENRPCLKFVWKFSVPSRVDQIAVP